MLGNSLSKNDSRKFRRAKPDAPRQLAYEILREVIRNGEYSNLLLPRRLSRSGLEERDRALVTELVYGSIRQIGRNDYIASRFSNIPWSDVDPEIVDVVRIGAYQLFDTRIPNHAAVSTTVDLARLQLGESKASFVNALMRRLSERTLDEHLEEVQGDSVRELSIRYSHPEWIINSYMDLIPHLDELKSLLQCNNTPTSPTLVAWPSRSTQDDLIKLGAVATKYSKYGASLKGIPGELQLIKERLAGVQDEGSQIVASIFAEAAKDHESWLDLCAGPGGKATLLSLFSRKDFYANEISPARAKLIEQVVDKKTSISIGDGRDIGKILGSDELSEIKAVIADVPCTGLGALRRRPEVRWRRKPEDLPGLTKLQMDLSKAAIEILPPGGIFAYVTCSPHIAETKVQCALIERDLSVEKMDISQFLSDALSPGETLEVRDGYLQLWPQRHNTDAMFMAIFRKR